MVDGELPRLVMSMETSSPEETRAIARRLGEVSAGGEVILLIGDLGTGKTCFAQGLAAGLEVPEDMRVTSPTFTLHAEYPGRLLLNHLDLYRLDDAPAAGALGVEDMAGLAGTVTAVEWPEVLTGLREGDRLEVRLFHVADNRRRIELASFGPMHTELLERAINLKHNE